MAEPLDVAGRLAEGRPAVDTVGDYVWACHLLGYQNPDLTLHPAQIRDWYSSEDGLDLRALEVDRAALSAAATATETAQKLQEQQLDALAGAWLGHGGDASREFLLRHGEASSAAATAVRGAVDALAALRDELWRAVDDKVASAVEIDGRRQAERSNWLAATRTLTTGAGDRALASELIDQQVKPFVDNDIRSDWLAAMQNAITAISAAFDAATAALSGEAAVQFEVPGDLGPPPVPSSSSSASPVEVAGTAPAGWDSLAASSLPATSPGAGTMAVPAPAYPAAPQPLASPMPPSSTPAAAAPAMSGMPALGELGSGLSSGTGGLAGLGTQLADAIGGLLSGPGDALPGPPEAAAQGLDADEPSLDAADQGLDADDPGPDDDNADDDNVDDDDADDDNADEDEADDESESQADEPGSGPVETCEDDKHVEEHPSVVQDPAPPAPTPPQPIVEPPPGSEPLGAETPCEIAADELPQAGP